MEQVKEELLSEYGESLLKKLINEKYIIYKMIQLFKSLDDLNFNFKVYLECEGSSLFQKIVTILL